MIRALIGALSLLLLSTSVFAAEPFPGLRKIEYEDYFPVHISYDPQVSQVLNKPLNDGPEHEGEPLVTRVLRTKIDRTKNEEVFIDFDPGPSVDPSGSCRIQVESILHGSSPAGASEQRPDLRDPTRRLGNIDSPNAEGRRDFEKLGGLADQPSRETALPFDSMNRTLVTPGDLDRIPMLREIHRMGRKGRMQVAEVQDAADFELPAQEVAGERERERSLGNGCSIRSSFRVDGFHRLQESALQQEGKEKSEGCAGKEDHSPQVRPGQRPP